MKPKNYSSSEELDSDDERIRKKLRRKRSLKKQQYEITRDDTWKHMQLACQNNSLDKISNGQDNNKVYPVRYKDDGVNKTATYHSRLDKHGVKGRAKLTFHQTKNTRGVHFESHTQFAEGHQSTERIGEERFLLEENPQRLPEITMGALYVEDMSEEDENNNYLLDPDEIDITKHSINLEPIEIKKENGEAHWSQLVDESSRRYTSTASRMEPETNKAVIKRGNGEERSYGTEIGVSATVPGGENNVKAETTGQPSILRALLERATRNDIHSKTKTEEALDLKEKEILEQVNNQIKWKNIMTLLHHSTPKNINLTCGGSCTLRRERNDNESSNQSLNETISIISGTDSQYEHYDKEELPERWSLEVVPSDTPRQDLSQASFLNDYTPEQSPEGQRTLWPHNHPDQPEEYKNFTLPEPKRIEITLEDDDNPLERTEESDETCKKRKKKISKIHKRKVRNKLNKRLMPYYRKIKAKIQNYRIYCLKKHLKLLKKTVVEIKNKELAFQTLKDKRENEITTIESTITEQEVTNRLIHRNEQLEQTAEGSDAARDAYQQIVRDCTTPVTDNLETHKETIKLINNRKRSAKIKMENEETRLLKILRKKYERRDEREERRKERIEHLKRLIADMPSDPEDFPEEEEKRIEEEIKEMEMRYNRYQQTRKVFRITKKVYDKDNNEVADVSATINVKTNPARMNFDIRA